MQNTVKELRLKIEKSQEQLADILGVTSRTIKYWEAGHHAPSKSVIMYLEHLSNLRQQEEINNAS